MRFIRAETALRRYEAVRHRLPKPGRAGDAGRIADLTEIADRFDVFLLDAFGVLNIGEKPIEGVPERVRALQAAGKRVLVLTNTASVPGAALVEKYRALGYRFAPEDVISSRAVLRSELGPGTGQHWGVMAPAALQGDDLDDLQVSYLGSEPGVYDAVDGFLLLGTAGWTPEHQAMLETALAARPRPVWVGNPDIVAPRLGGFSIEPGFYAHQLADRTGCEPRFFGKPFRNIFDAAFARLGPGLDPARTIMVGDSLHTDILGAQNAGIASALVAQFGFFADCEVEPIISRSGIWPDYIVDRP